MKTVQLYIETKQNEFKKHPFFNILAELNNLEEINYFVPELTFWAMSFQDILRINEERVKDPYLKKIAHHHRLEDAGHEKWFLSDKKYISQFNQAEDKEDVAWLFSKDSQLIRDAAYAIMSEIFKLEDESLNVVLLLTIESTGHVFFENVVKQVKKAGEDKNLKYFSSSHLEVEMAHSIFEEEMERKMYERRLPISQRRQAIKMVDRCYQAFNQMLDGLVIACNKRIHKEEGRQHVARNPVAQTNQAVEYIAN